MVRHWGKPWKRLGRAIRDSAPEEIAPAYLFLASDQLSRKVTGHILMIDSGFSMMRP